MTDFVMYMVHLQEKQTWIYNVFLPCIYFSKVIGYNQLPTASNTDGFVSIQIKKKENDVRQQQQALVEVLHKVLGSKPTVMVCVEGVKPLPDDR